MANSHWNHLVTLAVAVLLVASSSMMTTCRGDLADNSTIDYCDLASNTQSLLPCMALVLAPGGTEGSSGCCSAIKLLTGQDDFIHCLCTRYDSKPESCKEALHNIRC